MSARKLNNRDVVIVWQRSFADRLYGEIVHDSKQIDFTEPEKELLDGEIIRRRRQQIGVTQKELAVLLGVSANTVARWERGEQRIYHKKMLYLALDNLKRQRGM